MLRTPDTEKIARTVNNLQAYIVSQTGAFKLRNLASSTKLTFGLVEDVVHGLIREKIVSKVTVIGGEEMFRVNHRHSDVKSRKYRYR